MMSLSTKWLSQQMGCICLFFILLISAYTVSAQHKSKVGNQNIYLIGDAGLSKDYVEPLFELLKKQIENDTAPSLVVFLGDNIYPRGLPDKGKKGRKEAEEILDYQISQLEKLNCQIIFIPGNHDWDMGGRRGIFNIKNQEKYIEEHLNRGNIFVPNSGCPGPKTIKINDNLVLIAIDTQWWLHQYEKPPIEEGDCPIRTKEEFILLLQDEIDDNKDKQIIVVGHHPIYSNGNHGGKFQFKDHLFPLTAANKYLYLPLPIIGSFYPFYRKNIGINADLANPEYQKLIHELLLSFKDVENLVYAAGHEHSLQYFVKNNQHYIVSGSGAKQDYVKDNEESEFAQSVQGLFKLEYSPSNLLIKAIGVGDSAASENVLFQKNITLITPESLSDDWNALTRDEEFPKTVAMAAGPEYKASKIKQIFWGKYYRDAWLAPVEFEVIDLYTEQGGLKPLEMGGRGQTKSLRVEDPSGNQYVLRSITKYPETVLPQELQGTVAAMIMKDQTSTSHPYAAYVIPPLARAAKIYHTEPKAYFLPSSKNLMEWDEIIGGQLVLFEQRAAKDLSTKANFGYATNALKSSVLIRKMTKDYDVVVNEMEVVRNRLFDMLIGDWDRHEDQWRWAEVQCRKEIHTSCTHPANDLTIYEPIPKDRDQPFAVFDGFFPYIVSMPFVQPRFQSYDFGVRNVKGLNFNARFVDRFFLNSMDKQSWLTMATELQQLITDEVIESSIRMWPDTIYKLNGEEIIGKLKWHRDHLPEIAEEYYNYLALIVNVVGSDKKEFIEITRINDDSTLVEIFKMKSDSISQKYYSRMFITSETKEIRVYALGGKDVIKLSGHVNRGPLVRIIGGSGEDEIVNSSTVAGFGKKTHMYDTEKGTSFSGNNDSFIHKSDEKSINEYNRKDYQPDLLIPNVYLGVNPDDGFFMGGGVTFKKQGFRKYPYKSYNRILFATALRNGAFNVLYTGKFTDVIGKLDLNADVLLNSPKSTNFFGYGNETSYTFSLDDNSNYLVRYEAITGRFLLAYHAPKGGLLRFGPYYSTIKTVDAPAQFLDETSAGINFISQERIQYVGLHADFEFSKKDKEAFPTRGIFFKASATSNHGISGEEIFNVVTKSMLSLYIPLHSHFTYAFNVSGTHVFNEFEYYHAASLGSLNYTKSNDVIRGYRRDRFSGRTSLAINNELRVKLFNFKTILFPGEFGINGFFDSGRVWYDGETSSKWHSNVGGGIWINPMDMLVINATYCVSPEEGMFRLVFGFIF